MKTVMVSFPGGRKVDARFEEFTVNTDQRLEMGGDQSAPSPLDLFFVSLAADAGYAALCHCQKKHLPTDGLAVELKAHRHPVLPRYDRIAIVIVPPAGLTEEQKHELISAVDNCAARQHVEPPPEFEVVCKGA